MKRSLAILLQVLVVLIGLAVLTFMLWEPHLEGRNAHATTFEIYFNDPFLAYAYVGSLPFFVGLSWAFGLFGHVRRSGAFSQVTVEALRGIRRCALAMLAVVAGAMVFILMFGDKEDRPAGLFMSLLVVVASSLTAAITALLARRLQQVLSQAGDAQV